MIDCANVLPSRQLRHMPIVVFALAVIACLIATVRAAEPDVLNIGSRRELFVDHALIGELKSTALKLHEPQAAGTVMKFDRPWEGVYCGYTTILRDGDLYRMYYLGYPIDPPGNFTCYAESKDGIHWKRPELGLVDFQGTKQNNILLTGLPECHNFSPFLDTRPGVPASERYKAVGGLHATGLMGYASADGIHWKKVQDEPVFQIKAVSLDSHNVAFYSESEQKYVCYFRTWKNSLRWVSRSTSDDFLHWSEPVEMDSGDVPLEEFYTPAITPYFRAPHLYVGLPSRFMGGQDALTLEEKKVSGVAEVYLPKGLGFNDMPLITLRDGVRCDRTFVETFLPPGIGAKNWTSRANYPAFGIVPTPDSDTHFSMYVNKDTGYPSAHLARYTLRNDGFISVHASSEVGELITKPFQFSGKRLELNYATSAPGSISVEIQDALGKPLPGFTLSEGKVLVGDKIDQTYTWEQGADVSALAGKTIRLRFVMRLADLYSFQFSK